MFGKDLTNKATKLLELCKARNLKIATAESCTGGLVSALLTSIPGSSLSYDRGFITYSDLAKTEQISVAKELIKKYGAVSEEVAYMMATGALNNSLADISVAVTGIAGPGGGSAKKPVGLVYIASCYKATDKILVRKNIFSGDRDNIRLKSTIAAISLMIEVLN
jgi:nicotinamide-nucleotide amidase